LLLDPDLHGTNTDPDLREPNVNADPQHCLQVSTYFLAFINRNSKGYFYLHTKYRTWFSLILSSFLFGTLLQPPLRLPLEPSRRRLPFIAASLLPPAAIIAVFQRRPTAVISRQGNDVILHDVIILFLQELDTAVRVVDGRGGGSVLSSVWAIAVKETLSSDEYFF
jgi:hypothetical protein